MVGRHDRALAIGIGVYVGDGSPDAAPAAYIPLRHRYLGMPKQLSLAEIAPLIALLVDPDFPVVTHEPQDRKQGALT